MRAHPSQSSEVASCIVRVTVATPGETVHIQALWGLKFVNTVIFLSRSSISTTTHQVGPFAGQQRLHLCTSYINRITKPFDQK